jgi:hypothetical protein
MFGLLLIQRSISFMILQKLMMNSLMMEIQLLRLVGKSKEAIIWQQELFRAKLCCGMLIP